MGITCYISGKGENWKALETGGFVQEVWRWFHQEKTENQLSLNLEIGKGSLWYVYLFNIYIYMNAVAGQQAGLVQLTTSLPNVQWFSSAEQQML